MSKNIQVIRSLEDGGFCLNVTNSETMEEAQSESDSSSGGQRTEKIVAFIKANHNDLGISALFAVLDLAIEGSILCDGYPVEEFLLEIFMAGRESAAKEK